MRTPKENVLDTLTGKKVLFIEIDGCLENGIEYIEEIIKEANIEHEIIFYASQKPVASIIDKIKEADAIIFMTQWLSETAKLLTEYVRSLQSKKIVIQVYINTPTWYYSSQHGTVHDVYVYSNLDGRHERFYKLTEKAYWDYENEFDK